MDCTADLTRELDAVLEATAHNDTIAQLEERIRSLEPDLVRVAGLVAKGLR